MPQSSALRREATNPTPITINSQDVPNPKDAKITNDGSVTFNAAQACWQPRRAQSHRSRHRPRHPLGCPKAAETPSRLGKGKN